MEIIDQKILHDSVRWPLSPEYQGNPLLPVLPKSKADTLAGDIVVANEDGDKLFYSQEFYSKHKNKITSLGYEPIAVVVVPASHTDDGTARCVSLKAMSYSTPEDGTYTAEYENFTASGNFIAGSDYIEGGGLRNIPSVDRQSIMYKVYGTTTKAAFPGLPTNLENSSWYISPYGYASFSQDVDTHDPIANRTRSNPCVSPYDEDGYSKNPHFHLGDGTGMDSYMNGKDKSTQLIEVFSDPNNHRDSSDLYGYMSFGHGLRAVTECNMYKTIGTLSGDWYLPEIGEACYLWARIENIKNSYKICSEQNINNGFNDYFEIFSSTVHWSLSSSYTYVDNWRIGGSGGNLSVTSGGSSAKLILAFIKI